MASKIGTYCVNLLHPSISLRILNTALYTFPEVLTRRFCLTNRKLLVGDYFLYSRDLNA